MGMVSRLDVEYLVFEETIRYSRVPRQLRLTWFLALVLIRHRVYLATKCSCDVDGNFPPSTDMVNFGRVGGTMLEYTVRPL